MIIDVNVKFDTENEKDEEVLEKIVGVLELIKEKLEREGDK